MSGFEIAGAVLASISTIISAVDTYKKADRRLKFWRRFWEHHITLSRDLEHEKCVFELNIKTLLLPLQIDDARIQSLLDQPGGPEWRLPGVEESIKTRLGTSYDRYLGIMEEFQSAVGQLEQELKLKPPGVNVGNVEYQINRLSLSADGGSKARQLLRELSERNKQLQRLLEQTDKVAQLNQQRSRAALAGKIAKTNPVMLSFWKKATGLYWALQATWCSCSCPMIHLTHMLLEHQTAHQKHQYEVMFAASESAMCWKLRKAFLMLAEAETQATAAPKPGDGVSPINDPVPKDGLNVDAKKGEDCAARERRSISRGKERLGDTREPGAQVKMASASGSLRQLAGTMLSPVTKQAVDTKARAESPTPSTSRQSTSQMTPLATETSVQSAPQAVPSSPTFAEMRGTVPKLEHVGGQHAGVLHYSGEDEDYMYYLYPEPKETMLRCEFVTLHQLINEDKLPPLKFRERLVIALSLAWSFLKLLESPWIPHHWTTKDIIFFPDAKEPHLLDLERPHLRGRSPSEDDRDKSKEVAVDICYGGRWSLTHNAVRQASLSRLGIVLEELCFRCSIEKRRAWQRGYHQQLRPRTKQEELETDVLVGLGWRREIKEEAAGLEFSQAVEWCLDGNGLSVIGPDSWRCEMLKEVVWPLERACQEFRRDDVPGRMEGLADTKTAAC
ncbi:hypothetical protein MAPG_05696 [Magnaporthiopsis poae ATCC 64411]|uniref:DUF7580 domain-containing protein n=1 Tax=Magnaporthiopsis poae (strain ATCC 64411 / 73-15) TaxID=644358 RepID=A0A0C4E030_MAGP6|nr:hypothetical protein MAPG_05696 [Magnaporthiopsis poae ATCC 64411]